ncbi:copper homeostasis protein CutC [Vibrio sp. S4M6]|uniref:copper homeostasis protein CutC n=1 Tax=Vibrio sinus TaxID=2946865 RepID=UPI00202A544B|nr:copper homeostasis protein CutC [Vibrio sinus]MCL9782234.1 copper homeostasis protein CutC [Vibrio sinus]
MQLEVCVDNFESIDNAVLGGATRIELCSSLALGGLTPSVGFMEIAATRADIPIYAIIRPRQGDFLYSNAEIELMLRDIEAAAQANLQGVVFGALNQDGQIDTKSTKQLIEKAHSLSLGCTFHRAIDLCTDHLAALKFLSDLGCERVLTSGLSVSAEQGIDVLRQMQEYTDKSLTIMAGAGVNADNIKKIYQSTGIAEFHMSGKSQRHSRMNTAQNKAKMGNKDLDDNLIPVTNSREISRAKQQLQQLIYD